MMNDVVSFWNLNGAKEEIKDVRGLPRRIEQKKSVSWRRLMREEACDRAGWRSGLRRSLIEEG